MWNVNQTDDGIYQNILHCCYGDYIYTNLQTQKIKHASVIHATLFSKTFQNLLFVIGFPYPLSANPTKWSNTLKQFVGNLPTNCLSVFDYFVVMALKELGLGIVSSLEIHDF